MGWIQDIVRLFRLPVHGYVEVVHGIPLDIVTPYVVYLYPGGMSYEYRTATAARRGQAGELRG